MYFKSLQVFELVDCRLGAGICHTGDGERDQQLVQVQKRSIVASEMVDLHLHDRVDDLRADQLDAVLNARKLFEGVEKQRRGGAQQFRGSSGQNSAVRHFHSGCGSSGLLSVEIGRHNDGSLRYVDAGFLHEKFDPADRFLIRVSLAVLAQSVVIAADDLLARGFLAYLVIADAQADHVDSHVCGRLIRRSAVDLFKDRVEKREDFYVAVVVDAGLLVGLEVERIDHVDIVQIRRSCLIGEVDRVVEGQVPYRESLKFGVAGLDASAVFVIELREAGRHLAASGAGSGHDHKGTAGLDVVVAAIAVFADDQRDINGISGNGIVPVYLKPQGLKLLFIDDRRGLIGKSCQHDAPYIEAVTCKCVDETQQILVISDSEVASDFILLNIGSVDRHHDLSLVL